MQTVDLYKLGAGSSSDRKPLEVFRDFFQERHIEDLKETLENILFVVLTTDSIQFETGLQRDEAIHTISQLLELAIAAESLTKKKDNAKG
jgi:hypothetical protein